MNDSTPHLNIRNIITAMQQASHTDETHNSIPDGLMNLSHLVTPLRAATIDGRAFDSEDEFALANFLGNLVGAFLPAKPTKADLTNCILGLTVFIAMILRTIPESYPDTTMEEFLIDAANQDRIIRLARSFAATPVTFDPAGQVQPNIAQFPIFHEPVPLTEEAVHGFIKRRIVGPLESISQEKDCDEVEEIRPNIRIDISDIHQSELIADAMNGFDEMYQAHYESEHPDGEDNDDYEDPF